MLEGILVNLNLITILAVSLGGITLGLYLAGLAGFVPAKNILAGFVTFVTIGWSFYLPFAFASMVTNTNADPLRFVGSMILWVIFTIATSVAYIVVVKIVGHKRANK